MPRLPKFGPNIDSPRPLVSLFAPSLVFPWSHCPGHRLSLLFWGFPSPRDTRFGSIPWLRLLLLDLDRRGSEVSCCLDPEWLALVSVRCTVFSPLSPSSFHFCCCFYSPLALPLFMSLFLFVFLCFCSHAALLYLLPLSLFWLLAQPHFVVYKACGFVSS